MQLLPAGCLGIIETPDTYQDYQTGWLGAGSEPGFSNWVSKIGSCRVLGHQSSQWEKAMNSDNNHNHIITTTIRNNKHILTEKRFKCNMLLQYHGNYIEINYSLICSKLTLLEFLLSISHINLDSHHVLRFFCSPNLPCCQPGLLQCSDSLASAILLPRFWPGQMCPETERLKISTGLLSTYINYEIQCCILAKI